MREMRMCETATVVKALNNADELDKKSLTIYEAIGRDFSAMEKKINTLEDKVDGVDEKVDSLEKRTISIETKLDTLLSFRKKTFAEQIKDNKWLAIVIIVSLLGFFSLFGVDVSKWLSNLPSIK